MIIFTSICTNYGHKARVLAESVHAHLPDASFFLCLTEKEVPASLAGDSCFDRIVLSKDMWDGNFNRFIFKHAIVEASTAVKGAFFQWLQREFPEEDCFIYLDPDCCVYSDFPEIREALREAPAVVCPHLLHPGNIDMELSSTAHGVYNLGFLAVNNSPEARRLIDWWAERLYLYCYDDIPKGIFTDQKWMDLAPCFFDVRILRHYGYDLAPWGLLDTAIRETDAGWMIQDMPLRFAHFSGYGQVAEMCMSKWIGDHNADYVRLYNEYSVKHEEKNLDGISKTPWSYAAYASGQPVSKTIREKYRQNWDVMFAQEDPFAESNEYFAEKMGIRVLEDMPLKIPGNRVRKKWGTARRILREQGMSGLSRRAAEKLRRRKA